MCLTMIKTVENCNACTTQGFVGIRMYNWHNGEDLERTEDGFRGFRFSILDIFDALQR